MLLPLLLASAVQALDPFAPQEPPPIPETLTAQQYWGGCRLLAFSHYDLSARYDRARLARARSEGRMDMALEQAPDATEPLSRERSEASSAAMNEASLALGVEAVEKGLDALCGGARWDSETTRP